MRDCDNRCFEIQPIPQQSILQSQSVLSLQSVKLLLKTELYHGTIPPTYLFLASRARLTPRPISKMSTRHQVEIPTSITSSLERQKTFGRPFGAEHLRHVAHALLSTRSPCGKTSSGVQSVALHPSDTKKYVKFSTASDLPPPQQYHRVDAHWVCRGGFTNGGCLRRATCRSAHGTSGSPPCACNRTSVHGF